MKTKDRNFYKNIFLLVLTCVGMIIAIEMLLFIFSSFYYPRLITHDDYLGWKYRPTKKTIRRHYDKNIAYNLYINKDGFRGKEFAKEKNGTKIMVLGDSITFGLKIDQDKIFCSTLENLLKQGYHNLDIDVMNFAITGFSPAQELMCLRKYADIYHPHIVVCMLYAGNDFEENVSIMAGGRFRPRFILKNNKLELCNTPNVMQRAISYLRDHIYIMYFLGNRFNVFYSYETYNEDYKVNLMCKILEEMHDYTKEKEILFLVYYIQDGKDRYPVVKQFCDIHGIFLKCINLKPEERIYSYGHLNTKGHSMIAELIYNDLANIGSNIISLKKE